MMVNESNDDESAEVGEGRHYKIGHKGGHERSTSKLGHPYMGQKIDDT